MDVNPACTIPAKMWTDDEMFGELDVIFSEIGHISIAVIAINVIHID